MITEKEQEQARQVLNMINEDIVNSYGVIDYDNFVDLIDIEKDIRDYANENKTFNEMITDARCYYNDIVDYLEDEKKRC